MRTVSKVALAAMLVVAAFPVTDAAPLRARSVGELLVDASGHANGLNLDVDLDDATGELRSYSALGAEVFEHVSIDSFRALGKLQGVGSSSILLEGSNAVLSLHDDALAAFKIEAKGNAVARYRLSEGLQAIQVDGSRAILHITDGERPVGDLVIVGADGAEASSARVHVALRNIEARLTDGAQAVFLAAPAHAAAKAHHDALLQALATGDLQTSFVTEVEGSAVTSSRVDLVEDAPAFTADAAGDVHAILGSASVGGILSFDLAYETLPARTSDEVSAYFDGKLLARAGSAADVLASADAGEATYHAVVADGRAHLLVAVPPGAHEVELAAGSSAPTPAQARAEHRSDEGARVQGGFEWSSDGKLVGDFVTSLLSDGELSLRDYTAVASRAQVFRAVRADGGQALRVLEDHRVVLQGSAADISLVDDAYGTILVEGKAPAKAAFELASGVQARAESSQVVRLEGARGPLGMLVLLDPASQTSRLNVESGKVTAALSNGSSVVYRGALDGFRSERAVALALADGRVGAQLLVGARGDASSAAAVEYVDGVQAEARAQVGRITVDYKAPSEAAEAFVLDARGSALLARTASDVRVLVDGRSALAVSSVETALSQGGDARYFAETSASGSLRLVVNAAGGRSVSIESALADVVGSTADAFGAFKVFEDGRAVGSFVTLRSDGTSGAVSDVALLAEGRTVFTSLVAGDSSFTTSALDGASTLVLENREARFEAADTTSGHLKIVAKQAMEVSGRVASGLTLEQRSDRVMSLVSADGAAFGSLVLSGAGGGSIEESAPGVVSARLARGQEIVFRAHTGIERELTGAQREMVNEAMANGRLAGQVVIQAPDGLEAHSLGQRVANAVATAYGDLKMTTAATRGRVDITVDSATHVGRTLLVTLDPGMVPGLATGDARILFDGLPAAHAESYADVLDPLDDGDVAEYFVLAGESGTQVLVSIPAFSVHTVTLEERQPTSSSPYFVYATIGFAALAAVQAVLLIRRKMNDSRQE